MIEFNLRFLNKHTLASTSSDGYLRVYDLIKNKKFRTLTGPVPCQLLCMALDSSDFIFTGSFDPYEIYMFSTKMNTFVGKLMKKLTYRFFCRS